MAAVSGWREWSVSSHSSYRAEECWRGSFLWEKIGEIVGFTPILMAEACWSHILPLTSSQQPLLDPVFTQAMPPVWHRNAQLEDEKGWKFQAFSVLLHEKEGREVMVCQQTPEALNVCLQVGSLSQLWGWHNPRVAGLSQVGCTFHRLDWVARIFHSHILHIWYITVTVYGLKHNMYM